MFAYIVRYWPFLKLRYNAGKLLNEVTYIIICLHLACLTYYFEIGMRFYPDTNRRNVIETIGASMIFFVFLNLIFHITSLLKDLYDSLKHIVNNRAIVVEPLYQVFPPNKVDPEDSEDDLFEEPDDPPE